ncbi:MAG TPA: SlyX family protein [Kofleriaceae bacterium]|nr:SlyX family protein [Kofleriaceae bacterium]
MSMSEDQYERLQDLEIKLAFQDKLIRELDALVRTFGDRLDKTNRELEALKQSIRSPETPLGPANEPPPHY